MPRQKIKFQTNIPVETALKFAEGKLCDSQFGDPQYMFTTTDDRVFFVAEKVAQKIHGLRLLPREPFGDYQSRGGLWQRPQGHRVAGGQVGFCPDSQSTGVAGTGGHQHRAVVPVHQSPWAGAAGPVSRGRLGDARGESPEVGQYCMREADRDACL